MFFARNIDELMKKGYVVVVVVLMNCFKTLQVISLATIVKDKSL